jgi:pimeloyl-ACP methyl ester carboxylesterase
MNRDIIDWKNKGQYLNYQGHKIFYFQDGAGDNLLILHGYPYSSFEWKDCIAVLSKRFKITVLDLLGMGFSDKPQNHHYHYEEHCDIINGLLEKLNISQTHLLTHDLGVSVAQELLARDLEGKNGFKILSCVFSNGGLFMDVYKPRFIQRLLSQTPDFIGKFISKRLSKAAINKSVKSVFGKNTQPNDAFLDLQWEILNYNEGKSITYLIGRQVFEKYKYQSRWISAMQKTAIPICYICGEADPNSGSHMAKRYEELIPNPIVYYLEKGIGHWPMLEDQKGFLAAFHQFLLTNSQ